MSRESLKRMADKKKSVLSVFILIHNIIQMWTTPGKDEALKIHVKEGRRSLMKVNKFCDSGLLNGSQSVKMNMKKRKNKNI